MKTVKLDILTLLTIPENVEAVLTEMRECVTDVSAEIAKHAIHCLGRIALRPEFGTVTHDALTDLLRLDSDYVTAETVVVMKDILRKYPSKFGEVGNLWVVGYVV